METINQTKTTVEQLDEMAKVFTAFGTPDKIYTNGDEMTARPEYATAEGKRKYLRRYRLKCFPSRFPSRASLSVSRVR